MFPPPDVLPSRVLLAFCLLTSVCACGRTPPRAADAPAPGVAAAAPPAVTAVRTDPARSVLSGTAAAGAPVRLGLPTGAALVVTADKAGRWSLRLPPAPEARIFGLSEKVGGRQVQGQGYLLVTPEGRAALLRAGAGAIRLDPLRNPALGAVDFDSEGGTVISGLAPPSSLVFVRVDGNQAVQTRADEAGRYAVVLAQPLRRGVHGLDVTGDTFTSTAQVEISPAPPLAAGPLRSQFTTGGRRIDWLTPGGGVQSTVLLD